MKKTLLAFISGIVILSACNKETANSACSYMAPTAVAPKAEKDSLRNYLKSQNITAVEDSSGVFYTISSAGNGTNVPDPCSSLTVEYTGSLLSGKVFDKSTAPVNFVLGQLVEGWYYGLKNLRSGGNITIYIPPALAYRYTDIYDRGELVIPKGSYLKFDVALQNVENR